MGSALLRSVSTPRATPPRQLNAQNCSNPRFRGSLGGGSASPPDPYENIPDPNGGGGGGGGCGGAGGGGSGGGGSGDGGDGSDGGGGGNGGGGGGGGGTGTTLPDGATTSSTEQGAGAGRDGGAEAVGGGSGNWRDASPTSYTGERSEPLDRAPMIILLGMLACPPLFGAVWQRVRRNRAAGSATAPPPAAGASPGPDDAFGAGVIGT